MTLDLSKLSDQDLEHLSNGNMAGLSDQALDIIANSSKTGDKFNNGDKESDTPTLDRVGVKWFSSNPDSSVKWLNKNNNDMEYVHQDGEIYGRKKGTQEYFPLDSDDPTWKDLLDIGADLGQGIAEGVGGVAAGVATMNPLAGYAAMGGIGAATEAAKQGIGSLLGIENNFDGGNIALSGGASALLPAIGNKVIKPAYNSVKNTVAPNIASFLSGIDKDIIKNINIDDAARNSIHETGVINFLDDNEREIAKALAKLKNETGAMVDKFGGDSINIGSLSEDAINALKASRNDLIPEHQSQVDALMGFLDQYNPKPSATESLMNTKPTITIKPSELRAIRDTAGSYLGAPARDVPYSTQNVAKQVVEGSRDAMENAAKDIEGFQSANKAYSGLMNQLRTNPNLRKFTPYASKSSDPTLNIGNVLTGKYDKETFKHMPKMQAQREAFDLIGKAGGPDMDKLAREYASYNIFHNPSKLPGNTLMENARGGAIGGAIGAGLGYLSGGGVAAGIPLTIGGTLAGEFLSSPYIIKGGAQLTKKLEKAAIKGAGKVNPYVLKGTPKAIYNMMGDESN